MFALLMALSSSVPAVTAGPDLGKDARVVDTPVAAVTVYSDRARVTRRGKAALANGIEVLRLADVAGAAFLDTLRVAATNARVLRVEAAPVERERFSIDQVEKLLDEAEAFGDALARLQRRKQAFEAELALLAQVAPALPVSEDKREGRPPLAVDLAAWTTSFEFLAARKAAARQAIAGLDEEARLISEKRDAVARQIAEHDLGGMSSQVIEVLAIVESSGGASAIELEYFMPASSWRPVYDLEFRAEERLLVVKTAAMVTQATGEDWSEVAMSMSTAMPGRGIDFPRLLTWTLGEKRELIPTPLAARRPPAAALHPPPTPAATAWEEGKQIRFEALVERLTPFHELGAARGDRAPARFAPSAPPPPPSPVPAMQRPEEARIEAAMVTADSAEAESVVSMSAGAVSGLFRSAGPSYVHTPLDLFEPRATRTLFDPNLPAVAAGGLDYVYAAPTAATVKSTGEQFRVPLAADSYAVEVFYEATPSLEPTAYLRAKVVNAKREPLLGGPVNIFVGDEFAGQGRLETTGPGGAMEFPLGADEDVRLNRKVIPRTRTEGVFKKDAITDYKTTIEVGNYKKKAITIYVVDQFPKATREEVAVKPGATRPAPLEGPDKHGIMRWKLEVPPGATRSIELEYSIVRPDDWQLRQE